MRRSAIGARVRAATPLGDTLDPNLDLLRRLVLGDSATLERMMNPPIGYVDLLDEPALSLMRVAAAVAIEPTGSVCSAQVDASHAAGADVDAIRAVIKATVDVIGMVKAELAFEALSLNGGSRASTVGSP